MNTESPEHVVIVGASLAGLRAVETARDSGFKGRITLIGEEPHLPYDRPPLSKEFLQDGPPTTAHHLPEVDTLVDDPNIDLALGTRATGMDASNHLIRTSNGSEIRYDAALIATGVRARVLPDSDRLTGVHVLRTLDDAGAIRAGLDAGARVVVIGGGFIGAEVASAAARRGRPAVVVEAAATPLIRAVGTTAGAALAGLHARHGTELRCGVGVAALLGSSRVEAVALDDGSEIPADLVVVGIGADPATDWLRGSGLTLDNGVVCDENMYAGDDVWAAGDVARWNNPLFGRHMRLEHWTNAGEQAVHATTNLLHPLEATAYQHVPYFWSDWYGRRIQFAGLPIGEPMVVSGAFDGDEFVALYREDDRLVGVLTLDRRGDIMKYRTRIARGTDWESALEMARKRNTAVSHA